MKIKFTQYIFIIATAASSLSFLFLNQQGWAASTTELEPKKKIALSLDDVARLALKNNFDIQLIRYDIKIAQSGKTKAQSIYDTIAAAQVKYRNDQSARINTFAGSRQQDNDYDLSLSKYKEEVYEEVSYEKPKDILKKLAQTEKSISSGIEELTELIDG